MAFKARAISAAEQLRLSPCRGREGPHDLGRRALQAAAGGVGTQIGGGPDGNLHPSAPEHSGYRRQIRERGAFHNGEEGGQGNIQFLLQFFPHPADDQMVLRDF